MTGSPSAAELPFSRPGGFDITDRALAFCAFPPGSRLLDLGCGAGATLRHVRRDYSLDILGVDRDERVADGEGGILRASAEDIPLPRATMDGVLMECSLSVMEASRPVLAECGRVLKPGGRLIVSDLYARGRASSLRGCLGRVDTRDVILEALSLEGFAVELFEDHSERLISSWAQMLFEKGAEGFYREIGADAATLKAVKCGYCLIVARKARP